MYGIMRTLELSYRMTFKHMNSNSCLFHYLHEAKNTQSFGTKWAEHMAYPVVYLKSSVEERT